MSQQDLNKDYPQYIGKPGYNERGHRIFKGQPGHIPIQRGKRNILPRFLEGTDGKLQPVARVERRIITRLAKGQSVRNIADIENVTQKKVDDILQKDPVQVYLRRIFDKAGATDDVVVKVITDGLNATQQREFLAKGEQGSYILKGEEKPDFTQRHATAMDIMKMKVNLKGEEGGGGNTFNLFQTIVQARKDRGLEVPAEAAKEMPIDVKVVDDKKP